MNNIAKNHKTTLAAILAGAAAAAVVSCSAPADNAPAGSAPAHHASLTGATTAASAHRVEQTHLTVWSVNSDGPDFQAILTGAVGDYGPAVTVHPDGSVDPEHTSELKLTMSRGSFRISIAALATRFRDSVMHWPYDKATCSIHGTVTDTAPVVAGSGTGAYQGITGAFTLTISLDEDWIRGSSCTEVTGFRAQLLTISGTGSVRP